MGAFLMEMTQTLMLLTTPHRLQTKKQKKKQCSKSFSHTFCATGSTHCTNTAGTLQTLMYNIQRTLRLSALFISDRSSLLKRSFGQF